MPFTIVGVTPPGFEGTNQLSESQDVSIPIAWEPRVSTERSRLQGAGTWWLRLMGRMKDGVTVEQAREPGGCRLDANAPLTWLYEHTTPRQSLEKAKREYIMKRRMIHIPLAHSAPAQQSYARPT